MDRRTWRAVVAVLVLAAVPLLVAGAATAGTGAAAVDGDGSAAPELAGDPAADPAIGTDRDQTESGDIVVTQEYRLTPDRPGYVDVQWRFEMPDSVTELTTSVPVGVENVRTTRFERTGTGRYNWTGDGSSGSITFTRRANETGEGRGPEGSDGRYLFVDAGEWALIEREQPPGFSYRGFWDEQPEVVYRNRTAGEGVAGQRLVYLGPHDTYTRTAHGQQFRLIVPAAATLAEDPGTVLGTVTAASARLRVGDRDARVLMIAAPASIPWGVRGLQTGERDFYAVADEEVDTARNVWVHEYVHTRQDFARGDETRWFTEATAEYYAAALTLAQDRIDFRAFARHLEVGSSSRYDDVTLAEPATWHDGADYYKGALVAGEIDRRVRLATDSTATLQRVFDRVNARDGPVSSAELLGFVRQAAGDDVAEAARRYTVTTRTPPMWSRGQHGDAFGTLPPSIRYSFPDLGADGYRVDGPYRNGTLAGALVTGETLAVDVAVTNEGGTAGTYDLAFRVNGETAATRTGEIAPGERVVETVNRTFTAPGEYRLAAGETAITVRVVEPATPVVTDLAADRTTVAPGGRVELTATVENRADRPGERVVVFRRDGTELARERVRFAGAGTTTVTATATLPEAGTYRFTAANASVTVAVEGTGGSDGEAAGGSEGGNPTDGDAGPGFGPAVTALAVAVAALLARVRG